MSETEERNGKNSRIDRASLIAEDTCPACGGGLDTGFECLTCGTDYRDEALRLTLTRQPAKHAREIN